MVLNAASNNNYAIAWWSVLLVEKPEYSEKTTEKYNESVALRVFLACYSIYFSFVLCFLAFSHS
jgi:hypothetical protein